MSWFLLNHHRFTKDLTLQKPGYSSTGRNLSDGPKRPDGPWRPWPRIGFPLGTNRMGPMQTMGSCSFSSYNILLAMASNLLILNGSSKIFLAAKAGSIKHVAVQFRVASVSPHDRRTARASSFLIDEVWLLASFIISSQTQHHLLDSLHAY